MIFFIVMVCLIVFLILRPIVLDIFSRENKEEIEKPKESKNRDKRRSKLEPKRVPLKNFPYYIPLIKREASSDSEIEVEEVGKNIIIKSKITSLVGESMINGIVEWKMMPFDPMYNCTHIDEVYSYNYQFYILNIINIEYEYPIIDGSYTIWEGYDSSILLSKNKVSYFFKQILYNNDDYFENFFEPKKFIKETSDKLVNKVNDFLESTREFKEFHSELEDDFDIIDDLLTDLKDYSIDNQMDITRNLLVCRFDIPNYEGYLNLNNKTTELLNILSHISNSTSTILPDFSVKVSFDNDLRIEFEKECKLNFNLIKDESIYRQSYYDLEIYMYREQSSYRYLLN